MPSKLKTPIVIAAASISALLFVGCAAEPQTPAKEPSGASSATKTASTTSGPSCNPKVGAMAPKLEIASMNGGGKVSIAPGKVTLIDFWATWCAPCKTSFPQYQALYEKYKSKGLEVVAVSSDEPDEKGKIPAFIKETRAKFPVGWDHGHEIAGCWKPAASPTAYIIDKKGIVRHIHNEWHPGDEKKLEEQIKALL